MILEQLLDLSSLTNSVTQIVELCSANLTVSYELNLVNCRAVQRENTLDTAAVRYTSNGKGLADATVLLGNDSTLEDLDTALLALLDTNVYLYGITDLDLGSILLHACVADHLKCIHCIYLLKFPVLHSRRPPVCIQHYAYGCRAALILRSQLTSEDVPI